MTGSRKGEEECVHSSGLLSSNLCGKRDILTSRYYGCGLVIPERLENCWVLDLGSGSGRDCYALSQLVGEKGRVTGIDMTRGQVRRGGTRRSASPRAPFPAICKGGWRQPLLPKIQLCPVLLDLEAENSATAPGSPGRCGGLPAGV